MGLASTSNDITSLREVEKVIQIPRSQIRLNPNNKYGHGISIHNAKIKGMAMSIKNHGILQPLIVRSLSPDEVSNDGVCYEVLEGNRRYFASGTLESFDGLPCIIRDKNEHEEILALQITCNEIRRGEDDFNPLEQCYAYKEYIKYGCPDFGNDPEMKPKELSEKLGIERTKVNRILLLDNLEDRIKKSCSMDNYHPNNQGEYIEGQNITLNFLTEIRLVQEKKGTIEAINKFNESLAKCSSFDPRIIHLTSDEVNDEEIVVKNWEKRTYEGDKMPGLVFDIQIERGRDQPLDKKSATKQKVKIKIPYDLCNEDLCELMQSIKRTIKKQVDESPNNEIHLVKDDSAA